MKVPNIFGYLDHRHFLKDVYELSKQDNPAFSYRYMGGKCGIDPSYLVKLIQGDRHLQVAKVNTVCEFLGLDPNETEYFHTLVDYNRSTHNSQSKIFFEKLSTLRPLSVQVIDADRYAFFQNWYNAALYEIILVNPFRGDCAILAKQVIPPITMDEVNSSLALMKRLHMLQQKEDGSWHISMQSISTGDQWISTAIRSWQRDMIQLGEESLEQIPKDSRDISTVTLGLSREGFEAMRERMRQVRQEFLELAKADTDKQAIYQFNFQIFPIAQLTDHEFE